MRITGRVQPGPPFSDLAVLAFANCLGCGAAAAVLLLTGSQFDWSKENWMKRIVLAAQHLRHSGRRYMRACCRESRGVLEATRR
jgi:hypothetical protein